MSDFIYCITLWRPWADWVALDWKKIETREHNRLACLVGKRIAIHAGLKMDKSAAALAARAYMDTGAWKGPLLLPYPCAGHIIALTSVTAHRLLCQEHERGALIECLTHRYGSFLENTVRLPSPIPMKGHQGIWKIDRKLIPNL